MNLHDLFITGKLYPSVTSRDRNTVTDIFKYNGMNFTVFFEIYRN